MQGTDETIDATVTGHPEMLIVHAVRDDGTKVGEIVRNYKNEQQPKSFLHTIYAFFPCCNPPGVCACALLDSKRVCYSIF